MGICRWITLLFAVSILDSVLSPSVASALPFVGNLGIGMGGHWMSESPLLRPIHDRRTPELTVHALVGHSSIPVAIEAYGSRTRNDVEGDQEASYRQKTYEVGLGIAGVFRIGPVLSHLGAGLTRSTNAWDSLDGPGKPGFSMTRHGLCISAGAILPVTAGFNMGVLGRYTDVDAVYGRQLGGWGADAFLGWGWGISR